MNLYPPLITALLDPAAYDHPCGEIRCIETHISWLLLTGDYAYKIKKPVDFGFLDFSTLERRKHFCEEEIRLNGRLAPQVYLAVVPITTAPSTEDLRINGHGAVQEYAVKMCQFDNDYLFDQLIKRDQLTPETITETAQRLAQFHREIAIADAHSSFGSAANIQQPVQENFNQLRDIAAEFFTQPEQQARLTQIQQWSEKSFAALKSTFAQRKIDGFIRECHGDLHLGNIVLIDGKVTPFDGIEFNPNLRWIDIISEVAFLIMDLQDHDRADLGQRLLNAWLEITGDYAGLEILPYYQCYRAMVRAKVAALTGHKSNTTETEQQINNYIKLANTYTKTTKPALLITHGLSGSGKTVLSQVLLESSGAIRLRSDVERKRLAGLDPLARSDSAPGAGLYSAEFTQRTFTRLEALTREIIAAGYRVIVDATFIRRAERDRFRQLAQSLNIPFCIVHCEADSDTLRQRVSQRQTEGRDASEAGLAVLEQQLIHHEPLDKDERDETITVDTTSHIDTRAIKNWLHQNS